MSDQIKVLSRDVLKNLIDGWGIFKACLTYRKTRPGYEREFYEIDKQVVDKFDLLILALVDKFEEPEPKCAGYPICDGSLVGLEHDEGCPLYKPKMLEPKWEPGTVIESQPGNFYRLDKWIWKHGEVEAWDALCYYDGKTYRELKFDTTIFHVHRLPHEFKVGDWFATKNNLVRRVAENCGDGSIVDEVGSKRLTSEIRHVPPPPKGEYPKKRAWDLGAVGGQSSDCVPPPKEEKPSREKTNTKKWEDWKVYFNEYKELIVRADSMLSLLEYRGYIKHELISCPESVEVQQLIGELRYAAFRAVETSEKLSQERHKCDACGKEFDPDDLQILCAKCAKMQIESILDCALHSELPTDRAVETSEKSHEEA